MDRARNAKPHPNFDQILHKDQYTADEAAYLLGIDDDVINQAVHRGDLHALVIGHDIISIERGDLVRWLERR